ncbi:MAG: molecular chaperone HtpG [Clostridiales bacterium]|nr:molecular chaperone HtpG [Clostridiales bacterium]
MQKGNISIHAQNIMPVIKRWLYSDKDIFIREIVSNGCDAVTKYKMLGKGENEDLRVTVTVDKEAGEIRVTDNGIGMTEEEVGKYINQVAFSSAEEFLKNYTGDDKSGIIGHFGLGFYSAFMAADKVSIDTLSWQEGARPVIWQSEDGMEFEMGEGGRTQRGTTVTLHIAEEEKEFLDAWRVRQVLERYCGYMSVPIYLEDLSATQEENGEEGEDKTPAPVNDVSPLWLKNPRDCTEEEYKETYRKLFRTFEEPLFWVHLNVDFPFNLKGILYFPRIKKDFGGQEGEIKLFNRQVFVADNIKEVIPEFLMLLKGVIDCPDLPLNVSRSFLQNDGYVKRLSAHITKKVADKLNSLFNVERKQYEGYWDDIHPFVKYGCMRDQKFCDMVKDALLYKTTKGEYLTMEEYKLRNQEKADKKVYYTTESNRQAAQIKLYTDKGMDVVVMDTLIDMNFMSFMEMNMAGEGVHFVRVDAAVDGLTEESDEGKDMDVEKLQAMFRSALSDPEMEVKTEAFSDRELPLMLLEDEQLRRYKEMSAIYGQDFGFPVKYTLVLNRLCPLVQKLSAMEESDMRTMLCRHLYDVARMSSRPLEQEDLQNFLKRSNRLAAMLADSAE